ncbi:hypothetical protein NUU61_005725 [Penicillium alfredii]|uniref:DUF7514 domain-containing protein n=1 Tax=Penicillium alfredii TaxID=1506179 RepID=A0A9W9FA33_9EURO|nr:uncharacterized protein NUU61_005725 [Penicillium alfredii]KAJ5096369.1 hypothetical protein NUU61_005725 [Penicillium alfredii]
MSSAHWGTLINPDKSPAPLLEQLCLGIAQLMPSFDSSGTTDLTPERLAAFYRKVGGNYDPLFLETKTQALSFIYQSLGCFHSLQPSTNPYEAPSIPSLLPNGFVRWQTIQLLMDPDEHSQYLQNAVELWDIADANGELFPKEIPRDAFPSEPDPEMLQWHEEVSRRLEYDYWKRRASRCSPPNFGAYHYHFSGKDPLPEEEDYFSRHSRRAESRRQSHVEPDRPSRRRHHHRRLSADHPTFTSRRPESVFVSRPDSVRSGYSSPRVPSPPPPPPPDRPPRSRGQNRTTWFGGLLSPDTADPQDAASDAPSAADAHEPEESEPRSSHRPRHLPPAPPSRARRHSHDAYTRRPARDLSPAAPRRERRSHESHGSRSGKSHSDASSKAHASEDWSRSKPPGVKFREYIFGSTAPTPAPEPPSYTQAPPPAPAPPRYVPRHRLNVDTYVPDDSRRGSYSAGSAGGSRPGSGGSGSERPRSYSSAGIHPRPSRYTSPVRGPSKRYLPASVVEDGYIPSRRGPIYD